MVLPGEARKAYRRAALVTAPPRVRVVIVHERALAALRASLPALERGDLAAHKTHLLRGLRAVRLAPLLLDPRRGGPLVEDLVRLYAHMAARLGEANLTGDPAGIHEVVELVETLLAGWRAAAEPGRSNAAAPDAKAQPRGAVRA